MSDVIVADRYAKAYAEIHKDNVKELKKDFETLEHIATLFELPEAAKVLNSPVMPNDLKKQLLNYAHSKCESSKTIEGFIDTIVEAKRVSIFPKIVKSLSAIIDEKEDVIVAKLVSAVELSEAELKNINASLDKMTGKTVKIRSEVDQSILGGFIVRMGHHLLDLSVKTKLDALTETAAV